MVVLFEVRMAHLAMVAGLHLVIPRLAPHKLHLVFKDLICSVGLMFLKLSQRTCESKARLALQASATAFK